MAEKKERIEGGSPTEQGAEHINPADAENHGKSHGDSRESSKKKKRKKSRFGLKKWILLTCFILILMFAGFYFIFLPGSSFNPRHDVKVDLFLDPKNDNLKEEMLSPFFIPPSSPTSRGAIRIDLSVVWNGLASIRFKKKELQIRGDLYAYMTKLAEDNTDLNPMIPFMEEKIGKIFRDSLGVRDLAIRIKEIKYF
jgi:hypothetical protein